MSVDEFTKLFTYMERRFNELEAKIDGKADRTDVDQLNTRFDQVLGRLDDIEVEFGAVKSQQNRHESWITKAGHKINLPYRAH